MHDGLEHHDRTAARIRLVSFGFKYGRPEANYFFDVGFLTNPAREQTRGWDFFAKPDAAMRHFVLQQDNARLFLDKTEPLIKFLAGIDQFQIFAFGCNAGRHRSYVLVEELARRLASSDLVCEVVHRETDERFLGTPACLEMRR